MFNPTWDDNYLTTKVLNGLKTIKFWLQVRWSSILASMLYPVPNLLYPESQLESSNLNRMMVSSNSSTSKEAGAISQLLVNEVNGVLILSTRFIHMMPGAQYTILGHGICDGNPAGYIGYSHLLQGWNGFQKRGNTPKAMVSKFLAAPVGLHFGGCHLVGGLPRVMIGQPYFSTVFRCHVGRKAWCARAIVAQLQLENSKQNAPLRNAFSGDRCREDRFLQDFCGHFPLMSLGGGQNWAKMLLLDGEKP